MMRAGIAITHGLVAGRGSEAARLLPRGTVCATLDWPLLADTDAAAVAPDVVAALSHALATCGSVAFRADAPPAGARVYRPPRARSIVDRLLGLGHHRSGLAVADDAATVGALFAYGGWSWAVQTALVFDPAAEPAPILDALGAVRDWRGRTLPAGARLLFGPGHDGDFAMVAAVDLAWLQHFEAALR